MGLMALRHCPACGEENVSFAQPWWGQASSSCPAMVLLLPDGWPWGTLVSQPLGGTRYPKRVTGVGYIALGQGTLQLLAHGGDPLPSRMDPAVLSPCSCV